MKYCLLLLLGLAPFRMESNLWGFYAHQRINRLAVFTLPSEMLPFYKKHIQYITENAVNPDRRRYAIAYEAPRHYIDIDVYGDSAVYKLPRKWDEAVNKYSEDTLNAYGIVPWYVNLMQYRLTDAMRIGDVPAILRLSADLGHYIADANVPLHTTENYNGQFTGQRGIHGFWESRLPELYSEDYNFFVGQAHYVDDLRLEVWDAVVQAHEAVDSVLLIEKELTEKRGSDKKFSFETRGNNTIRVYSMEFSAGYHKALNGMVERQMVRSVKMVGDYWYSCWINAGQPDLNRLMEFEFTEEELEVRKKELEKWKEERFKKRQHEH